MSRFEDYTTEELEMITDAFHFYNCVVEEDCDGDYAKVFYKLYMEAIDVWNTRSDRKDDEQAEEDIEESKEVINEQDIAPHQTGVCGEDSQRHKEI
ncbi:MAG: hypothetical protein LUE27_06820 [Clostridia bacterium]|nr:hypothetical protein [Clostridia bacterium]